MAQSKVVGIVAWCLVGILVIGVVVVALVGQQQAGRASALGEALLQVGSAVGVEDLDPGAVKDPEAVAAMQESITAAIQQTRMQLATATDDLTAAQTDAAGAQAEVTTLTQRVSDQTAQSESLSNELAAKSDELTAAQAELAQAREEAAAAAEEAADKVDRLEKTIDRLKEEQKAREAELAGLQEELAELQAAAAAAEPPMTAEDAAAAGMMAGDDAAIEEAMAVEDAAVAEPEAASDMPPAEPEMDLQEGEVIGMSRMFSNIRYAEDGTLTLRLLDGQMLVYENVPSAAVAKLTGAGDRLDMTYKFNIQGEFESTPPDNVVIRKYYQWNRRNQAGGEVRYVAPESPNVPDEPETEASEPEEAAE